MPIESFSMEPTEDNLKFSLENDYYGRNKDLWQFILFCDAQETNCSIALDARWGEGKTFFVKQAKMILDAYNPNIDDKETERIIKNAMKEYSSIDKSCQDEQTLRNRTVTVYYDAWIHDNYKDPMLSLIYEIVNSTAVTFPTRFDVNVVKIISGLTEVLTGKSIDKISQAVKVDDLLKAVKNQQNIDELTNKFFDNILQKKEDRLVVFIDELDRCRPDYAVRLLERVKHYFSKNNITFVFSINLEELQHTIKKFYGDGFDANRYLERFFDYIVKLPPVNMETFYNIKGMEKNTMVYDKMYKAVARKLKLSIRELEKYLRSIKIANDALNDNNRNYLFNDGHGNDFAKHVFVPLLIGLVTYDHDSYEEFVQGENVKPLIDIINNDSDLKWYCKSALSINDDGVALNDYLKQIYEATFNDTKESVNLGSYTFNVHTKEAMIEISNLLSTEIHYN